MVLPPRCVACGTLVGATGTLCPPCWARLRFIGPPLCERCGLPFLFAPADRMLCGACIAAPPIFTRARSALLYDEASKPLVLGFKHHDRTYAADGYAAWMARAGAELLAAADLVAPVPLHRWRLLRRGYNQAALLIRGLSTLHPMRPAYRLLHRRRATPSQGTLSRDLRRDNVRGAFTLHPDWHPAVSGCSVLLVDDVLTTGATVSECARVLRRAGAARVEVLTLARVAFDPG